MAETVRRQGTVREYDSETRSGSVFLDDGTELEFGAAAFAAGGLRLLRLGQRVNLGMRDGTISAITLATFPLPDEIAQEPHEPHEPARPDEPHERARPDEPHERARPDEPHESGRPDEPHEPGRPDEPRGIKESREGPDGSGG